MIEPKEYPVMVSIRCAAFNQVKYIAQCLDGFVMQQTTFPFEAIIHDDASTDGTTEIIREYAKKYPDVIKPVYEQENLWSKHDGSITKALYKNLRGKYIAICDGDDCWTDPLKLQKQVDFLESHPDFTMVHTGFNYIGKDGETLQTPDTQLYQHLTDNIKNGLIWHYLLGHSSFIIFSTIMYREWVFEKEKKGIDHGMFLSCSRQGQVQYLPDITTSYRILQTSAMRVGQERVIKSIQNAIFRQLYYYSSIKFTTLPFYRYNLSARLAVSEAIISSLAHFSNIKVERKSLKLIFILFSRPLNIVTLPIALVLKLFRRIK